MNVYGKETLPTGVLGYPIYDVICSQVISSRFD